MDAQLIEKLTALMERLTRLETRLVKLAAHFGLDADGNPARLTHSPKERP